MRTYIVAIDTAAVNNWLHLPLSYVETVHGEQVRIVTVGDMQSRIVTSGNEGPRREDNFDLAIVSKMTTKFSSLFEHPKVVTLPREGKAAMQLRLETVAAALPGYSPIPTWERHPMGADLGGATNPYAWGGIVGGKKYIIKSQHGARGSGQILVPENIPIFEVMQFISRYSSDENKFADALKEKFPGVVYNTDGEGYAGEGLRMLRDQGYVVQEYLSDVSNEWRVLAGANGRLIWCPRIHYGTDYKQATGATGVYVPEVANGEYKPPANVETAVKQLVVNLNMTGISLDIYERENGSWGAFEYSNQFGTMAFYPEVMEAFHRELVVSYLEKVYPNYDA